jgi:integrase
VSAAFPVSSGHPPRPPQDGLRLLSLLLLALVTGQRRADLAKMRFSDIVVDEAGAQYLRVEQQKEAGKA